MILESSTRPKLLMIGSTYLTVENRKKIRALHHHFEVTLLLPKVNQLNAFKVEVSLDNVPGEDFKIIPLPFFGNPEEGTRYGLWGLSRVIKSHSFDVILVEAEPWSWIRWQTWVLKRIHCPQTLFGEFTWENLPRPGIKGKILSLIYFCAAKTTDFVIAGNQDAKQLFQKSGLWEKKILVAPQLGVDPLVYHPVTPETKTRLRIEQLLPEQAKIIGFVGRFIEEKGIFDLIHAIESARDKNQSIYLALLGSGPREDQIKELQNRHDWIHVLPPRPHHEIPQFLQSLDLLVLPSKTIKTAQKTWKEQFGHVLIEAMACGIPVIGSDSGAIPEVIQNPSSIFKEGDINQLEKIVVQFFRDSDRLSLTKDNNVILNLINQHYTHASIASTYDQYIQKQLHQEKKSLIWIDPTLGKESPTTKPLFESIPYLLSQNWRITFLGFKSSANPDDIHQIIIQIPKPLRFLFSYFSPVLFHLSMLSHRIIKGRPLASIIHATHGTYFFSDMSTIQFWNTAWLKMQIKMKCFHFRFLKQLLPTILSALFENSHRLFRPQGLFLAASRGICDAINPLLSSSPAYRVFPNAYNSKRFNLEVRLQHRDTTRKELGFQHHERVFLFASQGHYERKGFWRAFHALKLLKTKEIPLRFLIVGGTPKRLNDLKSEIRKQDPHFETWITFTGTTDQTEKYFSAADAFLFPSYFEAFCLAEIECAALGIPLLLTRHPGVEMILRPGKNGLLLPEEPDQIAQVIENDFLKRSDPWIYDTGEAVTQEQYSHNLNALYEEIWENKFNRIKK